MYNLRLNNKRRMIVLFSILLLFFFSTILVPFWFINYLSLSGVGHFFIENRFYSIISASIIIYFIIVGEYYYNIKIDAYIIQVRSYRVVLDFLRQKNYVDIPHSMLVGYAFFNRPFSFNKTLMLKIRTDRGRVIARRFNLTLISEREVRKTASILETIMDKNK